VIGLDPGLDVAAVDGSGEQRLDAVWGNDVPEDFRPRDRAGTPSANWTW
jgi:hypothetical protein